VPDASRRSLDALGTIRVRTTLAALVVVGASLLVGAIALLSVLRHNLIDGVREATSLRADDIAVSVRTDGVLPPVGGDRSEELVQLVVDGHPQPPEDPRLRDLLVVTRRVETADGPATLLVGRSLGDAHEATRLVARSLAVGLPVLLLVVGVTAWRVVGRALRPVDQVRAEVEAISGARLHRRVTVPPASDEIQRLALTMNGMLARLDDAQERQRRFVSDASHELRSPVASIRHAVEVALAHPDRTDTAVLAETVLEENLRVEAMIEDLLALARSEGTTGRPRCTVDLDDLVFEALTRVPAGGRVQVDRAGVSGAQVHGDPDALSRMVRNLVANAVRHARTRIAVDLVEAHGSVVLRVGDDGLGIPAGDRARVFERFVRLDEARTRDDGGTGLGLAIVAEVAGAHGGTAEATNSRLGGACVEVRLPALDRDAPASPSAGGQAPQEMVEPTTNHRGAT
jgi:signal transduction histidine kinase